LRSHAPFKPIVTKFCLWGRVDDVITDAKFYGNRLMGFGVTGAPKRHFLYLTFIALTTVGQFSVEKRTFSYSPHTIPTLKMFPLH